jgi:hypothetical protein
MAVRLSVGNVGNSYIFDLEKMGAKISTYNKGVNCIRNNKKTKIIFDYSMMH